MAPKHHPTPLSGGDRKSLQKELGRARAMTTILAGQSAEARAKGEALIRTADKLLAESWNERIWSNGEPIDLSPTIDQRPRATKPAKFGVRSAMASVTAKRQRRTCAINHSRSRRPI